LVETSTDLAKAIDYVARATEDILGFLLPAPDGPEKRLIEAMRYAVLGGGKRLRPFLVRASAELFDVAEPFALRVAAAVEMVHGYSLIHDDLPCMDNAELRRGKAATHIRYDQATAILAGDALQALAFEVLAAPATHSHAEVRTELVRALAAAAGPHGMVGGQAIDLAAPTVAMDLSMITRMQQLKTGALFGFCCEAGAILGHADPHRRQALKAYAHDLGLVYQIVDDLLDAEGSAAEAGKAVGRDRPAGKATFISILGIERARDQAAILAKQAARHLDIFGRKAQLLGDLAGHVVARHS